MTEPVALARNAIALAKRGMAVFPLKAKEKTPATKHGFKDATTDQTIVAGWWAGWPEQNIAIATGERSGIWVLDVDGEHGEKSLAALAAKHDPLPPTVEVITGKGRHLYFKWTAGLDCTSKRLGPGLDTRGNGGYVVAVPSVHPSGRRYEYSVDSASEFAEAPEWLVGLLTAKPNGYANGYTNGHTPHKNYLLKQLPQHLIRKINEAVEKGERSEYSYYVMCQLFEHGLTDWDVQTVSEGSPFAEKFWHRGDLLEEVTRARSRWEKDGGKPKQSVARWLTPIDVTDFLSREFTMRNMVLAPIIPAKGLVMIYASRGIGKTHAALGISYAVATGGSFLRWNAPQPRKVLHIDGEMPVHSLQERLRWLVNGAAPSGMLHLLAGDLEETGIGNLTTPQVQACVDAHLDGVSLLTLDNLSSLTSTIRDNDAESWGPIQDWLLRLRRRGIAVLIVHHAGKGGDQRGTSRREDILDTSISFVRPSDYSPSEGARFEVHFKKSRGIFGNDVKAFEARLEVRDDRAQWTTKDMDEVDRDRVAQMLNDSLSIRDIAETTGLSKSTVHRIKSRIDEENRRDTAKTLWGHQA